MNLVTLTPVYPCVLVTVVFEICDTKNERTFHIDGTKIVIGKGQFFGHEPEFDSGLRRGVEEVHQLFPIARGL